MDIKFPEHRAGLYLEHNPNRDVYMDVRQFLVDLEMIDNKYAEECISADELWVLQWYPETPVGCYYVIGPTLESVLEQANEY